MPHARLVSPQKGEGHMQNTDEAKRPVRLYSTCPPFRGSAREDYTRQIHDVARWSEQGGCEGILVYTDNGLFDPWLVAQLIIQRTNTLSPLVAVQPVYMHPYTVAKLVTSLSYLHGRRIDLNMVAGGFKNDLLALHDTTPHDQRYERLVEYVTIIGGLLSGGGPVTFNGQHYSVTNLSLTPALDPRLTPRVLISGSSAAGLAAAEAVGALSVQYPGPPTQADSQPIASERGFGIRVGVIARDEEDEAWAIAHDRFPVDRRGQITHQLAMKVSDSVWHKQLSETSAESSERSAYWMVPFQNYKTFCPYLVGSYERVAEELARYLMAGCDTIILDVPTGPEDMGHNHAVESAAALVAQ
jgi:alkanesulfonate monooxygenase